MHPEFDTVDHQTTVKGNALEQIILSCNIHECSIWPREVYTCWYNTRSNNGIYESIIQSCITCGFQKPLTLMSFRREGIVRVLVYSKKRPIVEAQNGFDGRKILLIKQIHYLWS